MHFVSDRTGASHHTAPYGTKPIFHEKALTNTDKDILIKRLHIYCC